MLPWASAESNLAIFYVAVILIALGDAMESTLQDFLECQLEQKVKQSVDAAATNSARDEEKSKVGRVTFWWWWYSAFLTGSLLSGSAPIEEWTEFAPIEKWTELHSTSVEEWSPLNRWTITFKIVALLMLAAYFWFYLGCFSYFFEEPIGSPLYQIYRVFKAAIRKLKLRYPASEDEYHWKNLTQKEYVYRRRDGQVRLKPHVPSLWRWLDKAAIVEDNSNSDDEHSSVEEVREVRYVASLTHFGITLLPCSLVKAAGSTFFIRQANMLDNDFHISLLLLLKFCTRELVVVLCWIFKLNRRRRITIMRIGGGMFCAFLCCFVAWAVDLICRKHKVPESMWSLKEAFTEFVLGVGNLLLIPFVFFFSDWFVDSIKNCRLYDYYLTLGFLNIAALLIFGYYSWTYAYNEGGTMEMEHVLGQSHRESQEQVIAAQVSRTVLEGSNDATGGGTSTAVASDEQPLRMAMQQTRLISRSSSMVRRDQRQ